MHQYIKGKLESCYELAGSWDKAEMRAVDEIMHDNRTWFLPYDTDIITEAKEAEFFAVLAKTLNYLQSDLLGRDASRKTREKFAGYQGKFQTLYNKVPLRFDPNAEFESLPQSHFSHKGWHCVQFIVMVFQMAQVLHKEELSDSIFTLVCEKQNPLDCYFSRIPERGVKVHPVKTFFSHLKNGEENFENLHKCFSTVDGLPFAFSGKSFRQQRCYII